MTWLRNGAGTSGASNSVKDETVPAGTVATDWGLLVATGSSGGTPVTPSSSTFAKVGGGGTFTQVLPPTQLNNHWISIWKCTGVVAGDVIRNTLNSNYLGFWRSHWFDRDPAVSAGALFNRGGTSQATCIAPSVTGVSVGDQFTVVSTERTTADGTTVSSRTNANGFTVTGRGFLEEPTSTDSSIDVSEFTVSSGTATGTVTITYSGGSGNGGAIILKQGTVAAPSPAVDLLWMNSMEDQAVRAGFIVQNSASTKLAVSTSPSMTSPVKSSAVATTSAGWYSARVTGLTPNTQYYCQMECDGVLTGPVHAVKTLDPGTPRSFKFLTGSCQDTGSNHTVYDRMALEDAAFLVHQGDLHYADTNVESTWRAAFLSSMNAAKFAAMRSKYPMDYIYDNHDWAGQGFEADDWDSVNNPRKFVKELAGEYPLSGSLFKTWAHGRVRFVHTDLWSERDPDEAAESSTKRAMAQAQEDLFLATLEAAKEPLIVWFTHWPLYTSLANGRWGSYTTQRDRIKAWLDARPGIRSRMVAIGGDSHSVSADDGTNQSAFGSIPTLNASAFNKTGSTFPSGTWNIVNYDVPDTDGVYSRCTITDTTEAITLLWEAVNQDGTTVSTASYTFKRVTFEISGNYGVLYVWDGTKEIPVVDIEIAP